MNRLINWLNLMKPSLPILNPYLREFSDPPSRETQQYHSSNSNEKATHHIQRSTRHPGILHPDFYAAKRNF